MIGRIFLRHVRRDESSAVLGIDLHADYPVDVAKGRMRIMLDVFNVLDRQTVVSFDDDIELRTGVTDPDFGQPISYMAPRSWRLAARWEF